MSDRLLLVHVITALNTGGAERQVESIVRHSRHRQHVIALYGGGKVGDALVAAGHTVEVLGVDGARRLLALPLLAARLRRLRPDAVQAHLLSGQLWGLPAARLAGVRTALSTEHSINEESIEARPLTPSLRRLYLGLTRLATRTIAVSDVTAQRLRRWGVPAEKIAVIDNGFDFGALAFDPAARAAVRAELGIAPGTQVIGSVGRLEPLKRFQQLIEAVAPTLSPGRRELVITGAGPLEPQLRARAEELGVSASVHLTGSRSDVPAVLAAMDVFVSPSRDEAFGMAVVEGIGAGLPVLYAECPALEADGLTDGLPGILRIAEDDGAEAESIRTGIDEALRAADGGRLPVPERIRQKYDIRATTARLDDLVEHPRG
jgi:glycosyltransferase involved in cell wall biosynthesis